jgi:zinc and cadmium transporter
MSQTLLQIIAAGLLGGFLSMAVAVVVTFRLPHVWLNRMVSFSAGLLLSIALLDLLPDALQSGLSGATVLAIFVAGLLGFFAFEKGVLAAHSHGKPEPASALARPVPLVLLGSAMHIWTDGMMLAAAFLAAPQLGWSLTFAVIAHEIPREGGDFSLLLAAGWAKKKALLWNAVSRSACVAGGVMGYYLFDAARGWIPVALTLAAAGFIYIALFGILPWVRQQRGNLAWHGGFMAAGAMMVPLSSIIL